MRAKSRPDFHDPDVIHVLSASWVFACNDENPIITYEGVRHRLDLDSSFDLRALIQSRGELFRRGIPKHRLEAWKQQLRAGRHLPSWIRDITEDELRAKLIEELSADDVFRCQFRADADAPKASLEIIDWGLQHIERLRTARHEALQKTATSRQMILVFVVGLLNIVATIIAAYLKK